MGYVWSPTHNQKLKCFHVFCEKCLQSVVHEKQSLTCPHCRQDIELPASGVPGLQGAFYIHYLFDIQDALQKVSSSNQTMCNKCKKREAARFCRTCGFVCQRCVETHQEWEEYSTHEIIDLDTLTGDVTTLVPPLKKTLFCSKHPAKEADLYCDECDELICRDCIVFTVTTNMIWCLQKGEGEGGSIWREGRKKHGWNSIESGL